PGGEYALVPGAEEQVEVAVAVQVRERGRVVVEPGEGERVGQPEHGPLRVPRVLEDDLARRVERGRVELRGDEEVEIAVPVDVARLDDRLGAEVDPVQEPARADHVPGR